MEQNVFKLYDAKAKDLFLKEISKFSWYHCSKIELYKKVWKMEAKWKAFNQCKHFGGGSYMFISTSEIGYLTLCYLSMTWLNWSLKFYTGL